MATRWKNKLYICFIAFLFAFGLSGLFFFVTTGNQYIHKDYFHTPEFKNQLGEFAMYLNMFELNEISLEEAKEAITVTEEDLNEHRYRYGDLTEQINNIEAQYENQIQEAFDRDNQVIADSYIKERDHKIADITKNFESDEHVRPKVKKEKEKNMEEFFEDIEKHRSNYLSYKEVFTYNLKNSVTDKVYTNLDLTGNFTAKDSMNQENMLFVTNYTIPRGYYMYDWEPEEGLINSILSKRPGTFEGQIGIANSISPSSSLMSKYENYNKKHIFLIVYSIASIVALILSVSLVKLSKVMIPGESEKWSPYYNKLPIDLRIILFLLSIIGAFVSLLGINEQFLYPRTRDLYVVGGMILLGLVVASFFWSLVILQGKILANIFKDWSNLKREWKNGLIIKGWQHSKIAFKKISHSINEAFLNQSVGTQFFIVLTTVFSMGLVAIMVIIHPIFIVLYMLILAGIGVPFVMIMINKVGYFNQIFQKTTEIAEGNFGQDLQVTGNSFLSVLATNINVLKQGVKASQNEQAKSERLKTELITNVSHDLRTPLTSIITYTELLKTEDLSNEDRTAYLEIIDRKSKRLKGLIDDLFEVSKMASGNIELKKEKVDLVQLLQQTLGEHDNTISESNLHFRVTNSGDPVFALVDGQKMWRVFDNLIGNIIKYSLENSRVYILIDTIDDHALITFKNISKYELSENIDELSERFKRGDVSRHTEGSGLGLAIAKSIVDLHEGTLDIKTDGDLFKVSISLKMEK